MLPQPSLRAAAPPAALQAHNVAAKPLRLQRRRQQRVVAHSSSPGQEPSNQGIPDAIPAARPDTDWREFRARLVQQEDAKPAAEPQAGSSSGGGELAALGAGAAAAAGGLWAHSLPEPEKGCILLAHPLMFQDRQSYFHQAAILVLEHNEMGSYGIILNQKSSHKLGELNLAQPVDEFKSNILYVGGDVGGSEVHVLHRHVDLPNSVEVIKGLCLGGIQAAKQAVAAGELSSEDFRWFAKYSGWGPGQLEKECRMGVWFPAAASASLILKEPEGGSGADKWHMVLQHMGGDFRELSVNVRAQEERREAWRSSRSSSSGGPLDNDTWGKEA